MRQCELNYYFSHPPPLYPEKGQDCVVEGTNGMSVQLYVLTKKQTERKPDPLLSPPNIFFSFPRRIVYLLCFMHWVTIDIDKNSITFCFPHSRNWAGKGGGGGWEQSKKSLTPLPAKVDQGEEGNGCTTITIVLKTHDRTAFFYI